MVLGFDKPFAHPTSSFNEPVIPPDSDPTDGEQVTVCFSLAWLPFVLGALSQLQLQTTWKTDTPDDTLLAQNRATDLIDQFNVPTCPVGDVEAPYWDDSDDVDDNAPADDQPWYGEVDDPTVAPTDLTFRENAEIWTFAGLLAIAGAPGAALSFLTIAPKFVLAFKQADIGKIIRVFVDASEAGQITDDGSGDVVEMEVVSDPSLETHQIYVTVGSS